MPSDAVYNIDLCDCVCVCVLQMAAVPVGGKFHVYTKEKLEAIIARIKTWTPRPLVR